ncbi:hypothetical protein [Aquimarina sp. AU474]|uniref:hypothetical protein n=1 Tax=Aquimarina sp. AU474 TaxID=2108529 RepID=UPI000D68960C|nr:hypothetical protein [Aquimarina sp. AU474]
MPVKKTNEMNELKEKSVILSELLMSDIKDESAINKLFQEISLSVNSVPSTKEDNNQDYSSTKETVGIWERTNANGKNTFQRRIDKKEQWNSWANVHEILVKSNKKRIVLIGESVARGYFYAPKYSVAKELESVLKISNAFDEVEVIDLSKTSIEMDELSNVISSSPLLEPDQIVLFAGNNWAHELYDAVAEEDVNKLWSIYKEKQFYGLKQYLEELFEKKILNFMDKLLETTSSNGIPCIIVIPGFNFEDWRSDESLQSLSLLPENQIKEWLNAKEAAEKAIAENKYNILEQEAQRMVQLDISNPLGHEFLAESKMKNGKISEAIQCLDEAKDTVIYGRALLSSPRCFKVVRETIKKKALKEQISVVDLFSVFNTLDKNVVPGKELYLDYCHLSSKGIKMSMKYVAQMVIEKLTNSKINISAIPESAIGPNNLTKAIAHFSAAIHNAHWSQPKYILDFHCKKAVEFDPKVKDVMFQFIDFASRKTSNVFCSKFEDILLGGYMTQYEGGMALTHGRNLKLMDLELVDAIVNAIEESEQNYGDTIAALRFLEHSVEGRTIDLLESFYHLKGYNAYDDRLRRNFLQIRNSHKEFSFFSNKKKNCTIKMCYRNSINSNSGASFNLYLNSKNQKIKEVKCSREWTNISFEISVDLLSKGLNKLIIEWPVDQHYHWEKADQIYDKLVLDTLFPIIGEIYSLTITSLPNTKL